MKLKIDENLPLEFKRLLIQCGHDVLTVNDQGLAGKTDAILAGVCLSEKRAFITADLDFSDIRAYPPEKHHGIVVIRSDRQDKTTLLEVFQPVLSLLATEPLPQRLWIIEKDRVRIRE